MRAILSLFALLVIIEHSYAQPPDTASLKKANFRDSLSVRRLIDTAFSYKDGAPFDALRLAAYASDRASELNNDHLKAAAINVKATIYSSIEDFQTALKLHYEALRIFEKIGYLHGTAMLLNNIGKCYLDAGKPEDALDYLGRAEKLSLQHSLSLPLLHCYVNGANAYTSSGQLNKALVYALKADSLNKTLKQLQIGASNKNTIGALYYFKQDYDKALAFYEAAKTEAMQANDLPTKYKAIINIGEVYEVQHRNPLPLYEEALKYAQGVKNYPVTEYAANNISNYYKTKKNYEASLKYYQLAVAAGEKNRGMATNKHLQLLQVQYETEKKEQEISLLNKENAIGKLTIQGRNKTIAIIVGLFVLFIAIGLLVYHRLRFRRRMLMQQQALLQREEITKAVIDAEEKERKRIAGDLHDGVGQLFSAVKMNLTGLFGRMKMEKDEDRFVAEKTLALVEESCKEVRIISHQMMPNMLLRSGIASDVRNFIEKIDSENLKVNFGAQGFNDRIESNAETVLYRVIQECVSNVIRHSKADQLDIFLNRNENGIDVSIADNGIGFDVSSLENFSGIGLKNIRARIEYLKGTVRYESFPGWGTKVKLWVPL